MTLGAACDDDDDDDEHLVPTSTALLQWAGSSRGRLRVLVRLGQSVENIH